MQKTTFNLNLLQIFSSCKMPYFVWNASYKYVYLNMRDWPTIPVNVYLYVCIGWMYVVQVSFPIANMDQNYWHICLFWNIKAIFYCWKLSWNLFLSHNKKEGNLHFPHQFFRKQLWNTTKILEVFRSCKISQVIMSLCW